MWAIIIYHVVGVVSIVGAQAAMALGVYPVPEGMRVDQTDPLYLLRVSGWLSIVAAIAVLFFQMRAAVVIPVALAGIWSAFQALSFPEQFDPAPPEIARWALIIARSSQAVAALAYVAILFYIRRLWEQGALRPMRSAPKDRT